VGKDRRCCFLPSRWGTRAASRCGKCGKCGGKGFPHTQGCGKERPPPLRGRLLFHMVRRSAFVPAITAQSAPPWFWISPTLPACRPDKAALIPPSSPADPSAGCASSTGSCVLGEAWPPLRPRSDIPQSVPPLRTGRDLGRQLASCCAKTQRRDVIPPALKEVVEFPLVREIYRVFHAIGHESKGCCGCGHVIPPECAAGIGRGAEVTRSKNTMQVFDFNCFNSNFQLRKWQHANHRNCQIQADRCLPARVRARRTAFPRVVGSRSDFGCVPIRQTVRKMPYSAGAVRPSQCTYPCLNP